MRPRAAPASRLASVNAVAQCFLHATRCGIRELEVVSVRTWLSEVFHEH